MTDDQAPAAAQAPVSARLPAAASQFLGRGPELAKLTRLTSIDDSSTAVSIAVITGMPGIGKTTLAVEWAHRMAARFPDGQLYLNLRGYDPDPPVTSADALDGLLRALGADERHIPRDTAERSALYRSMAAGRRLLVLLDNASSAEQVRPLLPGTPGCVVLVTSRDSLAGLVAMDGAVRLDLGLLSLGDATRLLRTLIGQRADNDPQAAADLAAGCARLPLALRLTAELVVARQAEPLPALARELAEKYRGRGLADPSSDPRAAMQAAFALSFQYLDNATARVFRLLGLHPAGEFESDAIAALAGLTARDAAAKLGSLARAHLIHATGPHRYGMHDLLREFAAEQAEQRETPATRRSARTRLFDYYLATAARAVEVHAPASLRPKTASIALDGLKVSVGEQARGWDAERSRDWLDTHRPLLVKIISYAAVHGWPERSVQLASVLFRYLDTGGYYTDIVTVYNDAARAAASIGDTAAQAEALNNLCVVDLRQGRYREAGARLEQSLALYLQVGDLVGQAYALGNLGIVDLEVGNYPEGAARHLRALALYQQLDDQAGMARTFGNLGLVYLAQGRYDDAISQFRRALELADRHGYRRVRATSLSNLGLAYCRQGMHQEAISHSEQGLEMFRELNDRAGLTETLNTLGEALLGSGQPERAMEQHTAALEVAGEIGYKAEVARSHHGLGCACQVRSRPGEARQHWSRAAALYAEIGSPQEPEVRALLADPV